MLLASLLALLALGLFLSRAGQRGALLLIPVLLSGIGGALLLPSGRKVPAGEPELVPLPDQVGSGACQSCHPSAYNTWYHTAHRAMTRLPHELSWDGQSSPQLPAQLSLGDAHWTLRATGEKQWEVEGPDLHQLAPFVDKKLRSGEPFSLARAAEQLPVVRRALIQVTGSQHYLVFWVAGPPGRELRLFPFVFLLAEKIWAPRSEVFLAPETEASALPSWNSNCIQCHAVSGRPGQSEGEQPTPWVHYHTQLTDRGIACEACHGPGRAHVEHFASPWRRHQAHQQKRRGEATPELHIEQPGSLSPQESSALCAQCHAYFVPQHPEEWWESGYTQRLPSHVDYEDARRLLQYQNDPESEPPAISRELSSIFWSDGTLRVGGREYHGLLDSPCFQAEPDQPSLGCLSCHQMHQSEPEPAQLLPSSQKNSECTNCHTHLPLTHSGHAEGSPGQECKNCHMPRTTYALLRATHSHRISSPSWQLTDPPSACALCHVDRSPAWLYESLSRLFPELAERSPPPPLSPEEADIPLGVRQLLSGNAAERAIYVDALVQPGTRQLVGSAWAEQLLSRLTTDPYPALRRMVERARRELAASPSEPLTPAALPPASLLDSLQAQRDDSPIVIAE